MNLNNELEMQYFPKIEKLFKEELGLNIVENYGQVQMGINYIPDLFLSIQIGQFKVPVIVEIKNEISHIAQITRFINRVTHFEGIGIVSAYTIENKIKDKLKALGIGFHEIDKEVFLPFNLKLDQTKNPTPNSSVKSKGFRAESSIKLMLYFVCLPEALAFSQRELAEKLDLSLGTTNKALKNLEIVKLIISKGRKRYLGRFDEIVERWRISFLDFETKSHSLGRFSPLDDSFFSLWQQNVISLDSYWGGEAAASIRTHYLRPALFKIYTYNDRIGPLLQQLRLKKDPNGRIEITKCFWPGEINNPDGTVPDFVTYCELLNSGIDRNIETAEMLKEKLKSRLKKYEY